MQHAVSKMRRPDRVCGEHARALFAQWLMHMCTAGAGSDCAKSGRTITPQRCRPNTANDDHNQHGQNNDDRIEQ